MDDDQGEGEPPSEEDEFVLDFPEGGGHDDEANWAQLQDAWAGMPPPEVHIHRHGAVPARRHRVTRKRLRNPAPLLVLTLFFEQNKMLSSMELAVPPRRPTVHRTPSFRSQGSHFPPRRSPLMDEGPQDAAARLQLCPRKHSLT